MNDTRATPTPPPFELAPDAWIVLRAMAHGASIDDRTLDTPRGPVRLVELHTIATLLACELIEVRFTYEGVAVREGKLVEMDEIPSYTITPAGADAIAAHDRCARRQGAVKTFYTVLSGLHGHPLMFLDTEMLVDKRFGGECESAWQPPNSSRHGLGAHRFSTWRQRHFSESSRRASVFGPVERDSTS